MKKKEFTSKLQLQKITIVSFNSLSNLKGGALQNIDTHVVSVDGYLCLTDKCDTTSPTTAVDNTCPPPTNTRTDNTLFCDGTTDGGTRRDCGVSQIGC